MKEFRKFLPPLFAIAFLTGLAACEPKSDTERMGEEIEDATDGASDAVEEAGDDIKDATD